MSERSVDTPSSIRSFGGTQYAILQSAFWLLITALGCNSTLVIGLPTNIINQFDPATREIVLQKLAMIKPDRWVGAFTLPLTGLILTHLLHLVSTRRGWANRPLRRLVPIALGACAFLSVLGFVIDPIIRHLSSQWWLQSDVPSGGFLYYLGEGSIPGFFVICAWTVIYYACVAFTRISQMELLQVRQESAIKDSRLDAIATQLNPHFLFNSLNTVRGLIDESPVKARDAVTHLAHVLRASLSSTRQRLVPLSEELETVHAHLMLERARHGSRLVITTKVDLDPKTVYIPPLLLQTVVENAVKHGVGARAGPGFVHYEAGMKEGALRILVRNSGNLADGWDLPGNGFGLIHVRDRLRLLFDGAASLSISGEDGVVTVEVSIPQRKTMQHS